MLDFKSHTIVTIDSKGQARVPFSELRLDQEADPGRVDFELLLPGAEEGQRAELKTAAHIWPGVGRNASGNIENAPQPSRFNMARSEGWTNTAGRISMDPTSDGDSALLAVDAGNSITEYEIPFRGVRVWRHRPGTLGRERIPHGKTLPRDHEARHDVLVVQAPDSQADLLVFGKLQRRPFLYKQTFEVPASAFDDLKTDDRLALVHPDGRVELLLRAISISNPRQIEVEETPEAITVRFTPAVKIDALGVLIETLDGKHEEGAESWGSIPVEAPLPDGVHSSYKGEHHAEIRIACASERIAARASVLVRKAGKAGDSLEPLCGADGHPVAIGIPGTQGHVRPREALASIAKLLSEPTTAALGDQLHRALSPLQRKLSDELAEQGFAGPLLPGLAVTTQGQKVARGDVLGAAPWLFEREFTAFSPLNKYSSLNALAGMEELPEFPDCPDPMGDAPGEAWLKRIADATELPAGQSLADLERGMSMLRLRLDTEGGRALLSIGALGGAAHQVFQVYNENLDRLRDIDRNGGKDVLPSRMVSLLERFARASRLGPC